MKTKVNECIEELSHLFVVMGNDEGFAPDRARLKQTIEKLTKEAEDRPRIFIEVSGGNIQRIVTNEDVDIVIVDHDNIDAGDKPDFSSFYAPDYITKTGEFYMLYSDENDPRDMEIRDELKRNHI
jgi:hypothetical protein